MAEGHASTWEETDELPAAVISALRRPVGDVVAIVATVDADGSPRTAALRERPAHHPARAALRLQPGARNVLQRHPRRTGDGRPVRPPDVAVGIRGRARVLKEQLECWPGDAAITIDVSTVKNDALPMAPVESGITYSVPPEVGVRLQQYFEEQEAAAAAW